MEGRSEWGQINTAKYDDSRIVRYLMFNRYLIYLSVIYNCLLQYSIIYNRTFCNDNIAMAMLWWWRGAVCARCAAPRCELCGGRAAHPDPLPPAHPGPGPQPARRPAAGNSSPLATRRGGAATAARRSPPRPPPVAPHGHTTAALHRAAADLTADSRHLVHCEQLDKIHPNY